MSIKNVILIGAGGNLGTPVLNTFLKESSFNITVLSRKESKSTFPSGVKVIHADYDSISSLKDAFQGQDAVVSLIGGEGIGDQNKLIDAAIAAGVKRFIPSEFGSDTTSQRTRELLPISTPKYETVKYLKTKESEISWTGIITGPFFDWCLKVGLFGVNLQDKSASLYDNGQAKFASTPLNQVGLTVIKVLEKPDITKNQYVYVATFVKSQEDILAVTEKLTGGAKWPTTKTPTKQLFSEGLEKLGKHDYSGVVDLIRGVTTSEEEKLGDFSHQGLWNERLGLPEVDFEATIKAVLEG